eukprot:gnl/Chilomastix_caulleri/5575.p2 GENE.gnl/Chilomastix_caulleri/5575~~gnl/Chilomastix_caulleri/5575.p2  ORF type:complete len:50 (+),score=0.99 gnl/Chilomastix_caulleri/5575:181-330(+)
MKLFVTESLSCFVRAKLVFVEMIYHSQVLLSSYLILQLYEQYQLMFPGI